MLNHAERNFIYQHAYLPEHLPDYVHSISGDEPFLHEYHLCYYGKGHLTFIGYPLESPNHNTADAYASACKRFQPASSAIVAPRITQSEYGKDVECQDSYYRLDLPIHDVRSEVTYMIRRAARELRVQQATFTREHRRLVDGYLSLDRISTGHKAIFKRIPGYLKRSATARLLEARKGSELVAFNVVDLGSAKYGFHLFNFRSFKINVPGASDLLFHAMALLVYAEGRSRLNLGLGIHSGVRRFKEKWGGVPFMPYATAVLRQASQDLGTLLKKL